MMRRTARMTRSSAKRNAEEAAKPPPKRKRAVTPDVVLDHRAFWHVIEQVIDIAPQNTLLALRATSKHMRSYIDNLVVCHILVPNEGVIAPFVAASSPLGKVAATYVDDSQLDDETIPDTPVGVLEHVNAVDLLGFDFGAAFPYFEDLEDLRVIRHLPYPIPTPVGRENMLWCARRHNVLGPATRAPPPAVGRGRGWKARAQGGAKPRKAEPVFVGYTNMCRGVGGRKTTSIPKWISRGIVHVAHDGVNTGWKRGWCGIEMQGLQELYIVFDLVAHVAPPKRHQPLSTPCPMMDGEPIVWGWLAELLGLIGEAQTSVTFINWPMEDWPPEWVGLPVNTEPADMWRLLEARAEECLAPHPLPKFEFLSRKEGEKRMREVVGCTCVLKPETEL